ncbi:molybdopterin molybdotransferase MoeA [Joostella sp. CR20]|uniref:molybdopterin molybdotransferase MoeA n=1 Tax=Joostella sp. CR20 TaxID=2804312 RepID=UPI00313BBE43
MISVEEALSKVIQHTKLLGSETVLVANALGFFLAEDVFAPIDLPPFRQSAMDGYAISFSETNTYNVLGEIQAGDAEYFQLKRAEAVKIFTGARVPDTADFVVMIEHVQEKDGKIFINQLNKSKTNIRIPGELIKKGTLALPEGTLLNSAALAFLSGLGIEKLPVYSKPKIAVLVTGNEVQTPGTVLETGKIYDSNSIMLDTLLKKAGIADATFFKVDDTLETANKIVKHALDNYDFLIASGGISVGDYDLMQSVFDQNGVSELFYKIKQRPGKPIYFGKRNYTLVFGLPGNPAACFINYQVYVLPAIQKALGNKFPRLYKKAILESSLVNETNKSLFLRAEVKGVSVKIFENQNSAMLQSLVNSNALVYIPETVKKIEKGEEVYYLDIVQ